MDLVITSFDLLAHVASALLVVACLYHWWVKPLGALQIILNWLGLTLAVYGVFQAYCFVVERFIAWYGGVQYGFFVSGNWYSSDDYTWLVFATSLPFMIAALLFWVPSIRSKPKWAIVLSIILLLPPILGTISPTEMPTPG